MKKDPSLHITRSNFKKILELLEIKRFPTTEFFRLAAREAANSRVVVLSNKQVTKQVNKILLASKGDAALAADIYYSLRISMGQRGIRKITQGNSRDWDSCKKLAEVCNNFCETFEFKTPREGFITYMDIGLKMMSNTRNSLMKLIGMSESISEVFEAKLEIKEDKDPHVTRAIHNYYVKRIAENTGITENYIESPSKYIHFLHLKDFLKERGWEFAGFIEAQFEALAFCNGIPSLETLYGEKAVERYNKWLYKNRSYTSQPVPQVSGSLWDSIKDK